jgi:hypothetical protein
VTDETGAGVDAVQLGRAIAATRAERGMKRGHLAESAGVSYPYLSELENGTKRGSTQKLAQIADALGLTSSQLLARAEALARGGTGAPTPWYSTTGRGPTGSPAAVDRGDDTRSPAVSLRPLGGLSERTEDAIVERVTQEVRQEIERWLDVELPIAVREHVRAALGTDSRTS